MFFYLSKIFGVFTTPSVILVLGTAFCVAALIHGPNRFFKKLSVATMVLWIVLAIFPVSDWVNYRYEQRYAANLKQAHKKIDGIIMLGGGIDPRLSLDNDQVSLNMAAERVTILPELMRKYPNAKVIYSGGSGLMSRQDVREADYAKMLFTQWNLPTDRIIFERKSRNTYENALFSKEIAPPGKNEKWLLVTSALHMPRSVGIFEKMNWPVIAYPVDFNAQDKPSLACFCLGGNLKDIDFLAHELVGTLMYRFTGKI